MTVGWEVSRGRGLLGQADELTMAVIQQSFEKHEHRDEERGEWRRAMRIPREGWRLRLVE